MATGVAERHVARPRLTDVVAANRVTVVEAGAGFGKSALAAECEELLGAAPVVVRLRASDAEFDVVWTRLTRAFRQAGFSDLAAAVGDADDLVETLARTPEPVLLVIDDVHYAEADSLAELLVELATAFSAPHRLLLLGRNLAAGAKKLRYAHGVAALSSDDLSFRPDELRSVLASHGVSADDHADAVSRATGGWPAAVVLAARRLANDATVVEELDRVRDPRTSVVELVQMVLDDVATADRSAITQLALLPLVSPGFVRAAFDDDGLWARATGAGLPIGAVGDGSFELPGPVHDYLVSVGTLDRAVATRAAHAYVASGELRAAVDVLRQIGDDIGAAGVLAGAVNAVYQPLEFAEVLAAVESMSAASIETHPRVLLLLARLATRADRFEQRFVALTRLEAIVANTDDSLLRAELDLEIAFDLLRLMFSEEAGARVDGMAERLGPDAPHARVQLLDIQGRVASRRADFESAERYLSEAKRLAVQLGDRRRASTVTYALATEVLYYRGRLAEALEVAQESLALADSPILQLGRLSLIADLAIDIGEYEQAEAALVEQRALALRQRSERWSAYVPWSQMTMASQRGDAERTKRALADVERHSDEEWFASMLGSPFYAGAADALARIGEGDLARSYIVKALEGWGGHPCTTIDAIIEARFGDPVDAEAKFEELAFADQREEWRAQLFRALAALRRGDTAVAGSLAAEAFELAASHGLATAPMVRERDVAEQLLGLAVEAGSAAARELMVGDLPWTVTMLGEFEVRRGGAVVTLTTGKPTQAVKLIATAGGRITLDEFIDALWPDADLETGRRGVRNVLNRLKGSAADLVVRDGNDLVLATGVVVDVHAFEREAAVALATSTDDGERLTAARNAITRYRGELLPSDRYEAWASVARERAKRRFVDLIDFVIDKAEAAGEIDEAIRLCERAIDIDSYDEDRYVRTAALLENHGRPTQARAVVERALAVLDDLGLDPSRELAALSDRLTR